MLRPELTRYLCCLQRLQRIGNALAQPLPSCRFEYFRQRRHAACASIWPPRDCRGTKIPLIPPVRMSGQIVIFFRPHSGEQASMQFLPLTGLGVVTVGWRNFLEARRALCKELVSVIDAIRALLAFDDDLHAVAKDVRQDPAKNDCEPTAFILNLEAHVPGFQRCARLYRAPRCRRPAYAGFAPASPSPPTRSP